MTQASYLFYDIETTGRNACFDQILQFAAIRTDLELNELERYELQVKLNPDLIPDPEAILIHQIPLAEMLQGQPEMEAIKTIHSLVNRPGTLSGGYNTLSFDDEFLRFLFYRNLLEPYTHQYASNCGRFDLYPMAMLYFLFKTESLEWPMIDNKPSLKLEQLNKANQLAGGGMAHTAIFDVEVTLALARKFFQHRSMWDYAQGYFNKALDKQRLNKLVASNKPNLEQYPLAIILGKAGAQDFFQSPAILLGEHYHYKNQQLWLRLDKAELLTTTTDNIASNTWTIRKKYAEQLVLPYNERFSRYLSAERLQQVKESLSWLSANPTLFQEIRHYHLDYKYPVIANAELETNLYGNGFLSDAEKLLCKKFHQAPPATKATLADKFTNPALQQIALRLLGRNYPELLSSEQLTNFQQYLAQTKASSLDKTLFDFRGNLRLTPQAALQKIAELRQSRSLDSQQEQLLTDLAHYLDHL